MKLEPGIGIGPFKFGMNKEEILEVAGNPDELFFDEDDETIELLRYFDLKCTLSFYNSEKGKLAYIRTKNPNLEFDGFDIIGVKKELVIDRLNKSLKTVWEHENYFSFECYTDESVWLSMQVEYNIIEEVELGVPIGGNDNFKWD